MNTAAYNKLSVDDLRSLLNTMSLQEQVNNYSSIVDRIFSTEGIDTYWDIINKDSYNDDYDKMMEFLSPTGQFFDLILKQMPTDKNIFGFEFPIHRLSTYTQRMIVNNNITSFISSKLHNKSQGSCTVLLLNAFEYYMFSFFGYIYHPSVSKKINWNGATDSLYCQLLFRYLDFFLFNNIQSTSLFHLTLQSRSRSSFNPVFNRSPNGSFASFTTSSPYQDSAMNRSRHTAVTNHRSLDLTEIYFTECIIQTIIEFWLHSYIDSFQAPIGSPTKVGMSAVPHLCPLPSVDQVCLVRVFLKHLYHFCYVPCLPHLTPSSKVECELFSKLNLYRQHVVPHVLIPKMQAYLDRLFSAWPSDLSFKMVLETWLSTVQPWRYAASAHHEQPDQVSMDIVSIEEWSPFVREHIDGLFGRPLLAFVRRAARMDLTVPRTAQMIFRVAKVIHQAGVAPIVARGDGGSVWAQVRTEADLLLMEIDDSLARLDVVDGEKDCSAAGGWLQWVWEGIRGDLLSSSSPAAGQRRARSYLLQARASLAETLGLRHNLLTTPPSVDRDDYEHYRHRQPDHIISARGSPQLTPLGRFQVAHGLCRLDLRPSIDYYDQPVCSHEIGPLVHGLARLSSLATTSLEEPLRQWLTRPDLIGRFCRLLLIGERIPANVALSDWLEVRPPHLRLRPVASKAFLFWAAVVMVIVYWTLDVGPLAVVMAAVVLYMVAALLYVIVTAFP